MEPPSEFEGFACSVLGSNDLTFEQVRGGGNAQVWRVDDKGKPVAALKSYPAGEDGESHRYKREVEALSFLKVCNEIQVPELIASNPGDQIALIRWVEGEPAPSNSLTLKDVKSLASFAIRLDQYGSRPDAESLQLAQESTLATVDIGEQIDRRIARLDEISDAEPLLAPFLKEVHQKRDEIWDRSLGRLKKIGLPVDLELRPHMRTLSPSDFGFHNTVRRSDGSLIVLDFEYFGWDDPVRLALDFELHPGMNLSEEMTALWREEVGGYFSDQDPTWKYRVGAWIPLLGLRWTLILLNEFLPGRWKQRQEAGVTEAREEKLRTQLSKAKAMLARAAKS